MRRRHARAVAVLALLAVTGCGGGASSSASKRAAATGAPTASPAATPTPAPPPPPPSVAAPIIVQVENLPDARPLSGVSGADLVYEYETEGGVTRFSSFFFAPPGARIGPVRSARLATVKLVQIYNGSLVYSGGSRYVVAQLAATHDRSYSEDAGFEFRISSRAVPHNLYTDGPHIARLEAQLGPIRGGYLLWNRTPATALPPGGTPARRVLVPLSYFEAPTFTYDAVHKGYTRNEPGTGLMIDADTGQPWRSGSIVVLHVPISTAPEVEDVSGAHGLDHGLVGSGAAEVFTGGYLFHATYTQGPAGPFSLQLADGSPAPIAPGQVLVELVRPGVAEAVG